MAWANSIEGRIQSNRNVTRLCTCLSWNPDSAGWSRLQPSAHKASSSEWNSLSTTKNSCITQHLWLSFCNHLGERSSDMQWIELLRMTMKKMSWACVNVPCGNQRRQKWLWAAASRKRRFPIISSVGRFTQTSASVARAVLLRLNFHFSPALSSWHLL